MKISEERRLQTRICLRKYQKITIDPETKKRISAEDYVYVKGELVPLEDAYYLEKDLYIDKSIPESIEQDGAYIDRMKQWNSIKFNECNAKLENHRISSGGTIQGNTVGNIEKFLSLYNGYPCRLTLVRENVGYNGYYYTYLQWIRISDLENVI